MASHVAPHRSFGQRRTIEAGHVRLALAMWTVVTVLDVK
jgi:hypothetical protein